MKLKQVMASAFVAMLTAFTATAADLTGAVAVVSAADVLAGKVAGVQVTSVSGQPGSGASIRVRGYGSIAGNSDPLVIIDGVQGDLNGLNPSDIESMEVLKDAASAAIYGARAANGVILVTTKRGTAAPIFIVDGMIYLGLISDIPQSDIKSITILKDASSAALYGARAGSGVVIVTTKNPRVDASLAPLYVIDGVAGGDFSMLDPADIMSLEVLKDASATAIYGAQGANGVVIITTKRGATEGVQLWENGPYFATCNLGATKPEEYGWYFWWGDTVGYTNSGSAWVSVVDGAVIKFQDSDATATKTYNKSNDTLLSEGWIDANTNLVAAHDAATAKLGAPWRMMTDAELAALVANCTAVWTNNWNGTGVKGYLVTGKTPGYTDKSIFLPAAGYGHQTSLKSANEFGDYWSSTPDPDAQSPVNGHAWTLWFKSDAFGRVSSGNTRFLGQSVRPVRSAPVPAEDVLKELFPAPSKVEGTRVILGEDCGPIELPDDLGEVTIVLNGWTISGADGEDGDGVTPGTDGGAPITIVPGGRVGLGATALSVVDTIADPADYLVIDLRTHEVTHQSVASVLDAEMFTNEIYKTEKLVLRWIPAGSYAVGSGEATDHNLPAFTAVVDRGYYIGLFELTEAQYSNACGIAGCTSTRPLTEVTWDEFSSFLGQFNKDIDLPDETVRLQSAKVNLQSASVGASITLPTELQWEIAARGGSAAEYGAYVNASGKTVTGSAQNIGDFAWYVKNNTPTGAKPVGLKRPNAFGLYDMAGNVWEWCLDSWETPYDTSRTNAEEACHADVPDRVMRGGTYNDKAEVCRPSYRGCNGADYRDVYNGFRLAVRGAKGPEPVERPESGEGAALVCGNGGEGNPAGMGCTNGVEIAEGASSAVTVDIDTDETQVIPGTDGREIAEVKFLQRYPWNGLVDISFALKLEPNASTNIVIEVGTNDVWLAMFRTNVTANASGVAATNIVWDAVSAIMGADTFKSDEVVVRVRTTSQALAMTAAGAEPVGSRGANGVIIVTKAKRGRLLASSAKGTIDLRPAVTLPQGETIVSNVTWSSKGWTNLVGALNVNIGYTNLTYGLTDKIESFLGSGVTNVALPAYSGDYRLTHSVAKLESFVTFTVDGLTNRTVTVPAALENCNYIVSNLTAGAKIDAVSGTFGGAEYDLPLGDKIAIYCVPVEGYEDRPVIGENPYVIETVTPATEVDSANLPKLGERLVDRIGVCSWSWHGDIADALDAMARDGRYKGLQLALAPWLGIDDTTLYFGTSEGEEAWSLITNKIAAGELNVMSTMINFPGEDYTTLESITNTQGYMWGVATNAVAADEQWASNLYYTAEAARLTAALGVKTLTTESGFICIDPELMFERMTNVCEICKAYGIDFLIESGPQHSLYMTNLLTRLNAAGYDNVGVNFDPGDTALFGSEDPVASFQAMRPWIRQVHAKDCRVADEREAWNEDCPWGEGYVSKLDFGDGHTFVNYLKAIAYSGNLLYERLSGDPELTPTREKEIRDAMTVIINTATMAEGTRENPWFVGDEPKWGVLAYTNELADTYALYFANAASSFDLTAAEYAPFRETSHVIVETASNYWIEPSVWRADNGEEYETPADAYEAGATTAVPVLSDGSVKIPPKAEIQRCADGVHFALWRNAEVGDPPFGPTNTLKAIMVSGLAQIRNEDVLLAIVPKAKDAFGELAAALDANLDASLESIGVGEIFRNRAFVGLSAKVGDVVTNEFASPIAAVFPWNVHSGRFYTVVRSVAGTVETLPEVRSLSLSDIGGLQEFFYVDYANKQVWISAKSLGYYAFGEINPEPCCLITVGNGEKFLGEDDPTSIATNFTIVTYSDQIAADDFAGYCVRAKGEAAGRYAINFTVVRKPEGLAKSAITILPGVFTITDGDEILKKWAEEDAAAGYPSNGSIRVRLACDPTMGTVKGAKVYKLSKNGTAKVSINASPKGSYVNSQGVRVSAGYVFAGWYLDPGFSKPASFDKAKDYRNASQTLTATDNVYLFARFVEKSSTADPIVHLRYAGAGYCGADASEFAEDETWYQGVALPTNACAVEFGSASLPTVTVKGLPAGVKFDKTTFRFTGAPTAASTDKKPVFTVTVSVKNKSGATDVLTKNIRVEPLPAWAIGKFDGYHVDEGVTNGTFTATVGKTGKISGKTKGGLADTTFSAKNFSDVKSVGDELCYVAEVTVSYKDPATKKTVKTTDTLYLMEDAGTHLGVIGGGDEDGCGSVGVQRAWDRKDLAFPAFSTKPAPTLTFDNGLTLKFGAKGKVTVSGTVNGVKVSGTTYVLPVAWHSTQTVNLMAQVYVYAPKAGVSKVYGILLECGADGKFAEASPASAAE